MKAIIMSFILILVLALVPHSVFAEETQDEWTWENPTESSWSIKSYPGRFDGAYFFVQWGNYLAQYYPTAQYGIIPKKAEDENLYVQIYGKDTESEEFILLETIQIAKWYAPIKSTEQLTILSNHSYHFSICLAEMKDGVYEPISELSDIKSVYCLLAPSLDIRQEGNNLILTWKECPGAEKYNIYLNYCDHKVIGMKIAEIAPDVTEYIYENVRSGVFYSFGVSVQSSKAESKHSDKGIATV